MFPIWRQLKRQKPYHFVEQAVVIVVVVFVFVVVRLVDSVVNRQRSLCLYNIAALSNDYYVRLSIVECNLNALCMCSVFLSVAELCIPQLPQSFTQIIRLSSRLSLSLCTSCWTHLYLCVCIYGCPSHNHICSTTWHTILCVYHV